jgi:hypothetical protein
MTAGKQQQQQQQLQLQQPVAVSAAEQPERLTLFTYLVVSMTVCVQSIAHHGASAVCICLPASAASGCTCDIKG